MLLKVRWKCWLMRRKLNKRKAATCDLQEAHSGLGRELFEGMRQRVSGASQGASVL